MGRSTQAPPPACLATRHTRRIGLLAMDKGFTEEEFMTQLQKYWVVRPKDFIHVTTQTPIITTSCDNQTYEPARRSEQQSKPQELPQKPAGALSQTQMGDDEFWERLGNHLKEQSSLSNLEAQKILRTVKSRHESNISSLSLDQMD